VALLVIEFLYIVWKKVSIEWHRPVVFIKGQMTSHSKVLFRNVVCI